MAEEFTSFVRALATLEPGMAMPAGETFIQFMEKFRRVLQHEMRRRGLWSASPAYLCVAGGQNFEKGPLRPSLGSTQDDAFQEVVHDCFLYIFGERLRPLLAQLRRKKSIEGFLHRNVRNFLLDRQRSCDPFGYRIYQRVSYAVQVAAERDLVQLSRPKVSNRTWILFRPGSEDDASSPSPETTQRAQLPPGALATIRSFNDELMPDLILLRGQQGLHRVAEVLCVRLPELAELTPSLRFGDLVQEIKIDARARWGDRLQSASSTEIESSKGSGDERGESSVKLLQELRPDPGFAAKLHFRALVRCVRQGILASPLPTKTATRLHRLWEGLVLLSVDPDARDAPPTQRQLSRSLEIPRDRITELLGRLESYVNSCLKSPR